jgi:hypothetical protein
VEMVANIGPTRNYSWGGIVRLRIRKEVLVAPVACSVAAGCLT